jgi:hypothetical protein
MGRTGMSSQQFVDQFVDRDQLQIPEARLPELPWCGGLAPAGAGAQLIPSVGWLASDVHLAAKEPGRHGRRLLAYRRHPLGRPGLSVEFD